MPDVLGALRQRDALQLAPALAVEQAKLHLLGIGGEQREVGAAPVPGGIPGDAAHRPKAALLALRDEKNRSKRRNDKADLGNAAFVQRPDRPRVPDIAAAIAAASVLRTSRQVPANGTRMR